MTFDDGTVRNHEGRLLVDELSGAGNHGVGEGVEVVLDGVHGNALAIKEGYLRLPRMLLNRRREYTIAFWVLRQGEDTLAYSEYASDGSVLYGFAENSFLNAWNKNSPPLNWKGGRATTEPLPMGRWSFLACVFQADDDFRGKAHVFADDKSFVVETQTVDNDIPGYGQIQGKSRVIDDLRIYSRALSNAEIHSLYERGKTEWEGNPR